MQLPFRSAFLVGGLLVSLAACQKQVPLASVPAPVDLAAAHTLAQGACGGCHSVEAYGVSPNPASPEFASIGNREGLTQETLTTWLRDAHNYPAEMDFWLEDAEVSMIAAHILSLKREGYHPPM